MLLNLVWPYLDMFFSMNTVGSVGQVVIRIPLKAWHNCERGFSLHGSDLGYGSSLDTIGISRILCTGLL